MPEHKRQTRRLMIIDDDLMMREVLTLLAADEGIQADAFETGEAALEALDRAQVAIPDIVLSDIQMPGICGDSLARLLRSVCDPTTKILAMSGSAVPADQISAFDGFLMKPFSIEDVFRAAENSAPVTATAATDDSYILNRKIFDSFAQSMPPDQLRKLYTMSLDDADARIDLMRKALEADDSDAYRRTAHSIKGGCGMVGAAELAAMASEMEESGPQTVDNSGPLEQFLAASAHLRRILDALYK